MEILLGIVWILFGLALMAFGLWIFYAVLPLFYGIFGAGVGYWLGLVISGNTIFDPGWLPVILAIVGAVIFTFSAYFLEPARRILVGVSVGSYFGLSVAYLFGAGTLISVVLAVIGGVAFGIMIPTVFNTLVIIGTAVSGAAMVVDGANMILDLEILNRFDAFSTGSVVALVIWIVLAVVGLGWQYRNIENWVRETVRAAL
jgi:hypothetical protein